MHVNFQLNSTKNSCEKCNSKAFGENRTQNPANLVRRSANWAMKAVAESVSWVRKFTYILAISLLFTFTVCNFVCHSVLSLYWFEQKKNRIAISLDIIWGSIIIIMRILLIKSFHSVLTGHKQARPMGAVLMLTIPSYYYCHDDVDLSIYNTIDHCC